ncbi:MAG: phosphotransferase [Candidatus Sungiibacteriota bacterium]
MLEPNNHSRSEIRWKAVDQERQAEIRSLLDRYYAYLIEEVHAIRQVDESGEYSANYAAACTMRDGGQKNILVRRHILARSEDIINAILVMTYLRVHGLPVPEVIESREDTSFIRRHGSSWQVFEFISAGHYFRGTADDLKTTGQVIARMHAALRSFPMKEDMPHIDYAIGPLSAAWWEQITTLHGENEFETMLRERKAFIQERIVRVRETLDAMPQAEEINHGDLHPYNFLFCGDELVGLIDFGNIFRADQRYDVAMACHRLVRQYVVHQGKPWQETLQQGIELFLQAYVSMLPLCDECVRSLPAFDVALILRKMAYNFDLYMRGKRGWQGCLSQFQRFFLFLEETDAIEAVLA